MPTEHLETSFQRNQRLESTTDDDVPPPVGHHFRPQDASQPEPADTASDLTDEEVSSRLTIEDYLMSNLRMPNHRPSPPYSVSLPRFRSERRALNQSPGL